MSTDSSLNHWTVLVVDGLLRTLDSAAIRAEEITCASGISPSGTVHLGNLREVMTTHLVVEELRRRGLRARHLHSWDDYDRLRKVPSDLPPTYSKYIGFPLCEIPDPEGQYPSFADRNIATFERCLDKLQIGLDAVRQGAAYKEKRYVPSIEKALERRAEIFDVLAKYRTPKPGEDLLAERRNYYPFKPYCENCQRDTTLVRDFDSATATIVYECKCGYMGAFSLRDKCCGKLVWKVDWPMRWAYEGVAFEPGGEDHATPGSSYTVGTEIVRCVYGEGPPSFIMYGFVGASGTAKISSSTGTQMTPSNALEVFEPAMLRWLYLRRPSAQKFSLDFGNEVLRTYDEWDKLLDRQKDGLVSPNENYCIERSTATSRGAVDAAGVRVPFRVLSAAADLTQGNIQQIVRIASAHVDTDEHISCEDLQPRLECAHNWTLKYVPDVERTIIRDCFSVETWQELPAMTRKGLTMFFELTRSDSWTLESLTHALYGVPKLLLGLPIDLKEPTKELKSFQRQFFIGIYKLICGNETGPRLPTLFISLGPERIRRLLLPNNSPENTSA